ncbi:hypothetical protein J3E64_002435 [Sphingobium sp. OAS761]|uniref:hypothetical protein n=1 Tax=Sphingobium sp. OAS761 TaxID=2817901 RepID=UPI0020A1C7B5|nr:hypothetical protein [Sphingobium sp. OAS761]MCP1470742.1 hypothetical protein [Sphingobium sp. OAS761]
MSDTVSAPAGQADALLRDGELPRFIDPAPLIRRGRDWPRLVGTAVSLMILAAALWQLRDLDRSLLRRLWPTNPLFWMVFALSYISTPLFEFSIFRRLWKLPAGGFGALLRKQVSNEILLGYLGEVYFYTWARRHARLVAAPFGAIKDVAILSAIMGNIVALFLFVATVPLLRSLSLGISDRTYILSGGVILGSSFLMLLFRRALFSLPRPDLRFVSLIHVARIMTSIALLALLWHLLLPGQPFSFWLLLSSMRQLLARLPLVPNKDLVFAGIAGFVVGQGSAMNIAIALLAALMLATHLLVGLALGLSGLVEGEGRR